MSTFWTRARHVSSSCRCTLCNAPQSAIPRRVNINTAPARRKAGVSDGMTLFYGTVMAAALYTDASIKLGTRKGLDSRIDRTRDEAKALEESNRQRLKELGIDQIDTETGTGDPSRLSSRLRSASADREPSASSHSKARVRYLSRAIELAQDRVEGAVDSRSASHLKNQLRSLRNSLAAEKKKLTRREVGPSSRVPKPRRDANDVQDTVRKLQQQSFFRHHLLSPLLAGVGERGDPYPLGRSSEDLWQKLSPIPNTPYWIKRYELAVTMLVYRLIEYAAIHGNRNDLQSQLDAESLFGGIKLSEDLNKRLSETELQIRFLKSLYRSMDLEEAPEFQTSTSVSFQSMSRSDEDVYHSRQTLANALFEAFKTGGTGGTLLLRICKLLLSCRDPPDVQCFNVLLFNLSRLQHPRAAVLVWEALTHCGITPDENSVAAMLRTDVALSDKNEFFRLVNKMDVKAAAGLAPLNAETELHATKYPELVTEQYFHDSKRMDLDGNFRNTLKKYVRIPRTEAIYQALIIGYLETDEVAEACAELNRMFSGGLTPSVEVINAFLLYARRVEDVETGSIIGSWIIDGKMTGSKTAIAETVFILAELASVPVEKAQSDSDSYGDEISRIDRHEQVRSRDQLMSKVNDFALKNGIIQQPLQSSDCAQGANRHMRLAQTRLVLSRRLEQPILHLHLATESIEDRTEDIPDFWAHPSFRQPRNLEEFSAMKLVYLYDHFVGSHGTPLPTAENSELLKAVEGVKAYLEFMTRNEDAAGQRTKRRGRAQHQKLAQRLNRADGELNAIAAEVKAMSLASQEEPGSLEAVRGDYAPVPKEQVRWKSSVESLRDEGKAGHEQPYSIHRWETQRHSFSASC